MNKTLLTLLMGRRGDFTWWWAKETLAPYPSLFRQATGRNYFIKALCHLPSAFLGHLA
jgi:hypothetical protein